MKAGSFVVPKLLNTTSTIWWWCKPSGETQHLSFIGGTTRKSGVVASPHQKRTGSGSPSTEDGRSLKRGAVVRPRRRSGVYFPFWVCSWLGVYSGVCELVFGKRADKEQSHLASPFPAFDKLQSLTREEPEPGRQ